MKSLVTSRCNALAELQLCQHHRGLMHHFKYVNKDESKADVIDVEQM